MGFIPVGCKWIAGAALGFHKSLILKITKMASNPGKHAIQRVTSLLTSTRKLRLQSNLTGVSPESSKTFSSITGRRNPRFLSRLPVELGSMQSLMPLHSATASALLNSMLSSNVGQWGSLSEGFATPL